MHAEKNVWSFILKHRWMGNRHLEHHVKLCLPEMVLPNHRGVLSSIHGTFKLADVTTRCSTRNPQEATRRTTTSWRRPYKKAVLTSANLIDLLVPSSHLVIARAHRHQTWCSCKQRTTFVSRGELACHKTCFGNWVFFCASVLK